MAGVRFRKNAGGRSATLSARIIIVAVATVLAGCDTLNGTMGTASRDTAYVDFQGAIVTDEPRAAIIGREVLADGGTAADAVTAAFFALSVSLPTRAGLGAGGVCVGYGAEKNNLKAISFLPQASTGGTVAIPSAVRGFSLLQAQFGRMHWGRLVQPAEAMARFGVALSRAYVVEAKAGASVLDQSARHLFLGKAGAPLTEGAMLVQPELAVTLEKIRRLGPKDLYEGTVAQGLVDGARSAGLSLTIADLQKAVPLLQEAVIQPVGDHVLAVPPAPSLAGGMVVALQGALEQQGYFQAKDAQRPPLWLAALTQAAKMAPGASHAGTAPGVELVAVDLYGNSVACGLTMGAPFGTGRLAGSTGMLLAAPSSPGGPSLSPLLIINQHTNKTIGAVSVAAGGDAAGLPPQTGQAMASVSLQIVTDVLASGKSLQAAIERPRLSATGAGGALIEMDAGDTARVLTERKIAIQGVEALGQAGVILCPEGLPAAEAACEARSDPRGFGLAAIRGR